MALAQKRNTKQTMTYIIVAVVLIAGAVIAYTVMQSQPSSQTGTSTGVRGSDLPTFTTFGEDLYNTEQYKGLHNFLENVPEQPSTPSANTNSTVSSEAGNPNPFLEH